MCIARLPQQKRKGENAAFGVQVAVAKQHQDIERSCARQTARRMWR